MKSVQLTDEEIKVAIQHHARQIVQSVYDYNDYDNNIERLRYLNKRLNDKKAEAPTNANDSEEKNKEGW